MRLQVLILAAAAVATGASQADAADSLAALHPTQPSAEAAAANAHQAPTFTTLLTTEPDGNHGRDLAMLTGWVGDAHLVGLGESVHGTHELHRLAHRIFRHLADQAGFTVLALEIDGAHAAALDEFVAGTRDDLDDLLAQRWWASEIFYDEALRDLLLWMRRRNEGAKVKLRFAGFDLKQPALASQELVRQLRSLDPDSALLVEKHLAEILPLGGFGVFPNVFGYSARLPLSLSAASPGPHLLQVSMRLQATGMTFGSAGFLLRSGPSSAAVARATSAQMGASAEAGTRGLGPASKRLEAKLELLAGVEEAAVEVFDRGNGTIRFDQLEVLLDGQPVVGSRVSFALASQRPLAMPYLQVSDYTATLEPAGADGAATLRVACDPRIDLALHAARRITEVVNEAVGRPSFDRGRALRLRQLARLIVQATEWRTLVEPNRDVFLAENLLWLDREAFKDARVLALAHMTHSERRPDRMGAMLASTLGSDYRTVTMLTLGGVCRDFGTPAALHPGADLIALPLGLEQAEPLALQLAKLEPGDLVASSSGLSALQLPGGEMDPTTAPDVAILVRSVTGSRPLNRKAPVEPVGTKGSVGPSASQAPSRDRLEWTRNSVRAPGE